MASYRPITDTWILARSKVAYYGAYPAGFLGRARQLLGIAISDPLLHICAGKVKEYPFYGLGPNDRTIDIDPDLKPDFIMDVRQLGAGKDDLYPQDLGQGNFVVQECSMEHEGTKEKFYEYLAGRGQCDKWPAALIDRPYTQEDAEHYFGGDGADYLPDINALLARALSVVRPGGRVGVLDYFIPRPPKVGVRFVACIGVIVGFGNRGRFYTVYENDPSVGKKKAAPEAPEEMDEGEDVSVPTVAKDAVLPLGFAGCKACGGTGRNSKGGPCSPCEKKRVADGLQRSLADTVPSATRSLDELIAANGRGETLVGEEASRVRAAIEEAARKAASPPASAAEAAIGGF